MCYYGCAINRRVMWPGAGQTNQTDEFTFSQRQHALVFCCLHAKVNSVELKRGLHRKFTIPMLIDCIVYNSIVGIARSSDTWGRVLSRSASGELYSQIHWWNNPPPPLIQIFLCCSQHRMLTSSFYQFAGSQCDKCVSGGGLLLVVCRSILGRMATRGSPWCSAWIAARSLLPRL